MPAQPAFIDVEFDARQHLMSIVGEYRRVIVISVEFPKCIIYYIRDDIHLLYSTGLYGLFIHEKFCSCRLQIADADAILSGADASTDFSPIRQNFATAPIFVRRRAID